MPRSTGMCESGRVMAARRSAGLFSAEIRFSFWLLPLPRLAGVTNARCLLLGAPTVGALGEYAVEAG